MPSVFGNRNLDFSQNKDVIILDKDNYFMRIADEIRLKLGELPKRRAILVFFEN